MRSASGSFDSAARAASLRMTPLEGSVEAWMRSRMAGMIWGVPSPLYFDLKISLLKGLDMAGIGIYPPLEARLNAKARHMAGLLCLFSTSIVASGAKLKCHFREVYFTRGMSNLRAIRSPEGLDRISAESWKLIAIRWLA